VISNIQLQQANNPSNYPHCILAIVEVEPTSLDLCSQLWRMSNTSIKQNIRFDKQTDQYPSSHNVAVGAETQKERAT